jgi:Aspartyl protease
MRTSATILLLLTLSFLPLMASAQFHDTCNTHSWTAMNKEADGKSSLLCKGVADLAMGRSDEGRKILLRIIKQAPRSDAAFEAHERLLGLYARMGRVRKASHEISALLAIHPNAPDVIENSSFYETLGRYPDMSISHRHPTSFSKLQTDGSLNIPFTVNGKAATFYLDTGCNLSVISESEARALGLTVTPVTTKLQDSGGIRFSTKITDVDELDIGPIRLRHVPFLVLPASTPPYSELPLNNQGLLGIQVALALQTIRLRSDGQLDVAFPPSPQADAEHVTFDDMMPILHVTYRDKMIPLTFDTGAEHTTLNKPFANDFPEVVALGSEKSHDMIGLGGTVKDHSIELATWSVELGGKTATVVAMPVLLEKTTDWSEWAAGNLGIDVLQKVEPFTIDFRSMRLDVGQ